MSSTTKRVLFSFASGTALIAASSLARATTYYVDRNLPGNDSNAGTSEDAPFLTIVRCINAATQPGDTCLVKNGNYPEPWSDGNRIHAGGTEGNPITFKNYPGHSPTITMSSKTDPSNQLDMQSFESYTATIGWIVVEGFDVSNGWSGFGHNNVHDVIYRRNKVHDMQYGGFGGTGVNVTYDSNLIHHTGRFDECRTNTSVCNQDQAIYSVGTGYKVINNVIYDTLSYGIQVAGYGFDPNNDASIEYSGVTDWLIANNTIAYNHHRAAIVLSVQYKPGQISDGVCTNNRIENNIFYENTQNIDGYAQGVDFVSCNANGKPNLVRNNLAYATAPGSTGFIGGGTEGTTYTLSDNIVNAGLPDFVLGPATLPRQPDFHLQPSSAAIGAGRNLTEDGVTTDFNGSPRPTSGAWDIGAYAFGVADVVAPSAPTGVTVR